MRIAILGWGSLLWDSHQFDEQHGRWDLAGPSLKLEFSRVSSSRQDALTLVIDNEHGQLCRVAYCTSARRTIKDAVCDLRCREGTILQNIGSYVPGERFSARVADEVRKELEDWAAAKAIDAVVWTNLASNFVEKSAVKRPFSVANAIAHLQRLDAPAKAKAAEYVWRAPPFVDTPLRRALQVAPWFPKFASCPAPIEEPANDLGCRSNASFAS